MSAQVLTKEINLINSPDIKAWVIDILNNIPNYFFTGQASSTGNYHPKCTIKKGGLITHVKRAVYVADRLCTGWGIDGIKRDIAIAATILHDIAKTSKSDGTYDDYINHPLYAEKYFSSKDIPVKVREIIRQCIRNHMGLWTPDSIKKPITKYNILELLVYTSDYMSATKDLITPVDGG